MSSAFIGSTRSGSGAGSQQLALLVGEPGERVGCTHRRRNHPRILGLGDPLGCAHAWRRDYNERSHPSRRARGRHRGGGARQRIHPGAGGGRPCSTAPARRRAAQRPRRPQGRRGRLRAHRRAQAGSGARAGVGRRRRRHGALGRPLRAEARRARPGPLDLRPLAGPRWDRRRHVGAAEDRPGTRRPRCRRGGREVERAACPNPRAGQDAAGPHRLSRAVGRRHAGGRRRRRHQHEPRRPDRPRASARGRYRRRRARDLLGHPQLGSLRRRRAPGSGRSP